jgi:membrane-bound serine protease (ClpP class)
MDPWVWAILLMGLGAGLAILEVFFPSAGILAFLSAAAIVAAIIMGFYQGPLAGILSLIVAAVGLPTILVLGFKYWPHTAIGRRMMLTAPTSEEVLPQNPDFDRLKGLIGHTGRAKSKMLLSGVVLIDGHTIDAVSESMPIEVGQAVRVVQVRANRVVVRSVDEETPTGPPADPLQRSYDDPFDSPQA